MFGVLAWLKPQKRRSNSTSIKFVAFLFIAATLGSLPIMVERAPNPALFLEPTGASVASEQAHALAATLSVGHFEALGDGRFIGRDLATPVLLDAEGAHLVLGGGEVVISFPGTGAVLPEAGLPLPGVSNFMLGNEPSAWRIGVPRLAEVLYPGIHDGMDVVFYVAGDGTLEFDFRLAPGADTSLARFQVTGAATELLADGSLELRSGSESLRLPAPVSYQEESGIRTLVPSAYLPEGDVFTFQLGSLRPDLPLVIDPSISISSCYGGSSFTNIRDVKVAPNGDVIVVGANQWSTAGAKIPLLSPYQSGASSGNDAFVARFNGATLQLVWSTYLGGSGYDDAYAVAVTATQVTIVGTTQSTNFPLQNPFQSTLAGPDAFVAQLSANGQTLQYGTFFGGPGADYAYAVALRGSQIAFGGASDWRAGGTSSFPLSTNAFQVVINGPSYNCGLTSVCLYSDGFVAVLDPAALPANQLAYSSFLGSGGSTLAGSLLEGVYGIAVDGAGKVFVAGIAGTGTGVAFPTKGEGGAPFRATGASQEGFVAKFDVTQPNGPDTLVYSTLLGGAGGDYASDLFVDSAGAAYVVGTASAAIQVAGPAGYQPAYGGGGNDAWIVKMNGQGTAMLGYTYLGNGAYEVGEEIVQRANGDVTVIAASLTPMAADRGQPWQNSGVGGIVATYSADLTTRRSLVPIQPFISPDGRGVDAGIAVDSSDRTIVAGTTRSNAFPAVGGPYLTYPAPAAGTAVGAFVVLDRMPPVAVIKATDGATTRITVGTTSGVVPAFIPLVNTFPSVYKGVGINLDATNTILGDIGTLASYTYAWDTGAGYVVGTQTLAQQKLMLAGTKTVCLKVTDTAAAFTETCILLTWINRVPVAAATHTPAAVPLCSPVTLDGSGSSDPDSALTSDHITQWEWDFENDGTYDSSSTTDPTVQHIFRTGGANTVRLRVTDEEAATGTTTHVVNVDNTGVAVAMNDAYTVGAGQILDLSLLVPVQSVLGNDCHPTDLALMQAQISTGVTAGTLNAFNGDGTLRYTAPSNGVSSAQLTYVIVDAADPADTTKWSNVATVTFTIGVANPTEAVADTVSLDANTLYSSPACAAGVPATTGGPYKGVLCNDLDPANDAILGILVTSPTQTSPGGSFSWDADNKGGFSYQPKTDYCGGTGDSFQYQLKDVTTNTLLNTVTVQLNIACPPAAVADTYVATINTLFSAAACPANVPSAIGGPYKGVLCNDQDTANHALLAILFTSPTNISPGGSFSWDADNKGGFSYQPKTDYCGGTGDSFQYQLKDATTNTLLNTVTVQIGISCNPNVPPTATCGITTTLPHIPGQSIAFSSAESSDSDGSITAWSWAFPSAAPLSSSSESPTASWAIAGTFAVTLTVTDNGGSTSAPATCNVTITNTPPTAKLDKYVAIKNQFFDTLALSRPSVLANDEDAENNINRVENPLCSGLTPGTGTLTSFTYVGPQAGHFEYTPPVGFVGDTSFSYKAKDALGLVSSSCAIVTIHVQINSAPTSMFSANPMTVYVGEPVTFVDASTDPDVGGSIAGWKWNFGDGNTAHQASPIHIYGVTGSYNACLSAIDNWGAVGAAACRTIRVIPPSSNPPPWSGTSTTSGNPPPPPPPPPSDSLAVDAGQDQVVLEGDAATLRATVAGTTAPTYQWRQTYGPHVTITGANTATPSFTAPLLTGSAIVLYFEVTVHDGSRSGTDGVTVSIASKTAPPVAQVLPDSTVAAGTLVDLDGTASSGGNGNALTYHWTQWEGPAVIIDDAGAAKTAFTAPNLDGAQLRFVLEVSDGHASSLAIQTVTIQATAPPDKMTNSGLGFTIIAGANGDVTVTPSSTASTNTWDFGDGTPPLVSAGAASHHYTASGDYTIKMTGMDPTGTPSSVENLARVKLIEERSVAVNPNDTTTDEMIWPALGIGGLLVAGVAGLVWLWRRRAQANLATAQAEMPDDRSENEAASK